MLIPLSLTVGLLAGGCGGDADDGALPNDALAKVGSAEITQADLQRGLRLASSQPGEEAETRVMEALIRDEWVRQEAEDRGVAVSDAEVRAALDRAQDTGFLSEAALERAGMSEEKILPTVRKGKLQRMVTAAITRDAGSVSAEDVADYYRRNREQMVVPERRDVRLVLTKDRARAGAARAALERGRSWDSVAREYSLHEQSRSDGGRIEGVRKGPLDSGVTAAVFRARKGVLSGPVDTDRSWAVFLVERIRPPFRATLDQARDEIRELLLSERRKDALADFTREYRAKTTCAPGHRVRGCSNGPSGADPSL